MICKHCKKEFDSNSKEMLELKNSIIVNLNRIYDELIEVGVCSTNCLYEYRESLIPRHEIKSSLIYHQIGEKGKEIDYFTIEYSESMDNHTDFCFITERFSEKIKEDLLSLKSKFRYDTMMAMEYCIDEEHHTQEAKTFIDGTNQLNELINLWNDKNYLTFNHIFQEINENVEMIIEKYGFYFLEKYVELWEKFSQVRFMEDISSHFQIHTNLDLK